jgi:hypothetical protein
MLKHRSDLEVHGLWDFHRHSNPRSTVAAGNSESAQRNHWDMVQHCL